MKNKELDINITNEQLYDLQKLDAKLLRMIYKSVFIFKNAIEHKNAILDDPTIPHCKLRYPIKIIWDNLTFDNFKRVYKKDNIQIYSYPVYADIKKIDNIVLPGENIKLFKEVTNYIIKVSDKNIKSYIIESDFERIIESSGSNTQKIKNVLRAIGRRDFYFPFELEEKQKCFVNNLYYFKIYGLNINIISKTSEYIVEFGIDMHGENFTEIENKESIWKPLLDSIDKYVKFKNNTFIGKYPGGNILDIDEKTFSIPSHPIMFTLLAMFAGRPERIPRKLLQKPYNEMSKKERAVADKFLSSIIENEKEYNVSEDKYEEKTIAVVSDNPKVEAKAEIGASLFSEDLNYREGALAIYIKRAFGAEGLRHLLGLLIGLEESGRTGIFEWSINEHLNRLGYKKNKGTYKYECKKTSTEIVKIFTSLFITVHTKNQNGVEVIEGQKLFSIDGFKQETFNKIVIDETIRLRATDFWYKNAFEPKDGSTPKFTKLLYKIAQENHREHPLTIYLAPLFAVFWRINHEGRRLKLDNLIDWCDIKRDRRLKQRIRELENEFNYMKEQGYLGNWEIAGANKQLSECDNPLNTMLSFYPPNWLSSEFQLIATKKEQIIAELQYKEKAGKNEILSKENLEIIIKKSGLSNRVFAAKVGISPSLITRMLKGERKITKNMAQKINKQYAVIPERQ